jgi:hypothetical protein
VSEEQLKQLKSMLPRHSRAGKILPYSDEFEAARGEFNKLAGLQLTEQQFWQSILRSHGPKRKPPKRTKAAAPVEESDDSDDE